MTEETKKVISDLAWALDKMIDDALGTDPDPEKEDNYYVQLSKLFEGLKWLSI